MFAGDVCVQVYVYNVEYGEDDGEDDEWFHGSLVVSIYLRQSIIKSRTASWGVHEFGVKEAAEFEVFLDTFKEVFFHGIYQQGAPISGLYSWVVWDSRYPCSFNFSSHRSTRSLSAGDFQ